MGLLPVPVAWGASAKGRGLKQEMWIRNREVGGIGQVQASLQVGAPALGQGSDVKAPTVVRDPWWEVLMLVWEFPVGAPERVPLARVPVVELEVMEGVLRCVVG